MSWSYTGSLNTPRSGHTATLLSDGKVLVVGGYQPEVYDPVTGLWSLTFIFGNGVGPGSTLSDADLYNPATGSWKQTAKLNERRAGHTATLLSDGKVLVVGGSDGRAGSDYLRSCELYDPERLDPAPRIIMASVSGIKLFITGENFHDGAVILLNGEEQKSDEQNPQTTLIGKKAGKKIKLNDHIQVP